MRYTILPENQDIFVPVKSKNDKTGFNVIDKETDDIINKKPMSLERAKRFVILKTNEDIAKGLY